MLAVLFFHVRLGVFHAGYLGVDVFFVLSGFLITRVVKNGIERGDFSFSEFYFRRAKRLLPAAYVVFFATAVLAPVLLTSIELKDFRAQLVGAVTFTANFVLWRQAGYFGGISALKPLLHVWSLSLEEQYYFVLPASMFFIPRRYWKPVAMGSLIASFGLCLFLANKSAAAFYLLPTRGWELSIGSVGALLTSTERLRKCVQYLFWPALAALVVLPNVRVYPLHPGPDALVVCVATLIIVLREHPILATGRFMRRMAWVGDISYSLYLVHWPIVAFLNNVFINSDGLAGSFIILRVGVVVLALLLAFLLNRYVEEPARRARIRYSRRTAMRALFISCVLVVAALAITRSTVRDSQYLNARQKTQGMSTECDFKGKFAPVSQCETSRLPTVLVWGDSFAMHLVPGILSSLDTTTSLVQATRGECGPFLGIAPVEREFMNGADKSWARRCVDFNESVIRYLEQAKSVEVVVLSSSFTQYVDQRSFRLLKEGGGGFKLIDAGVSPTLEGLKRTVDAIRKLDKKVIVVGPPPQASFDVGRCLERLQRNMLEIGAPDQCSLRKVMYEADDAPVLRFLSLAPQFANVGIIEINAYLCRTKFCETYVDGTSLYADSVHLSREGSILVAKKTDLMQQIWSSAR